MYGDTMSNPHVDSFTLPLTTARPLEGNRVEKTRSCTCDCGGRGVNGVRVEGGGGRQGCGEICGRGSKGFVRIETNDGRS
jgi:hypothetical protein